MENNKFEGANSTLCSSAPKNSLPRTGSYATLAGIGLALGVMYVETMLNNYAWLGDLFNRYDQCGRIGISLFALLFVGSVEIWARCTHRKAAKDTGFWLAVTAALTIAHLAGGHTALYWIGPLPGVLLHCAAVYWAMCRLGAVQEGTGALTPVELLWGFVVLPFGNFVGWIAAIGGWMLQRWPRKKGTGKTLLAVVLGAVFALPVLVWAAKLLAGADPAFEQMSWGLVHWFEGLLVFLPDGWRLTVWLLCGCWLSGLLLGCCRQSREPMTLRGMEAGMQPLRLVPGAATATVLAMFCGLYLLFFAVRLGSVLGLVQGALPDAAAAAESAREGFFQLCVVAGLNLAVLAAASKLNRRPLRQVKPLRALGLALCAANLVFAALAGSELAVYLRFGLTGKRLLAGYGIAVTAIWSALALATLLRPRRAVRWAILTAAALFCAICFVPLGWMA